MTTLNLEELIDWLTKLSKSQEASTPTNIMQIVVDNRCINPDGKPSPTRIILKKK